MKHFIIVVVVCILSVGCTPSTRHVMDSWKGSHISEVIRSWGPPQQITTDGAGGQIYIWRSQVTPPAPTPMETRGEMRYNPLTGKYEWVEVTQQMRPQGVQGVPEVANEILRDRHMRQRVRMFYARPNGIIYYWRTRG